MKSIATQVGQFTTSDEVAAAALELWRALYDRRTVDIVDIPYWDDRGGLMWAQVVLGYPLPIAVVESRLHVDADLTHLAHVLEHKLALLIEPAVPAFLGLAHLEPSWSETFP